MVLADVNILVDAWRSDSPLHLLARQWLEETLASPRPFAMSEQVGAGFLRIVTHPSIFKPPSTFEAAHGFLQAIWSHSHCVFLRPGPRHWAIFVQLCRESNARGNLLADAYLAALAIENDCEWVTFDRDFRIFPGLRLRILN